MMPIPTSKDERPRYVFYRGRYYLDTGMVDYIGRKLLNSLVDESAGILADPNSVYPASEEQTQAIEKLRNRK